jgi:hypothetical protein
MSLRLWVSVLALLGVLAHAAAIPRHNAVMLAGVIETADKQAALAAVGEKPAAMSGLLCSAGGRQDAGSGKAPGAPGNSSPCPICMGLSQAHAILSACEPLIAAPFAILIARQPVRDMRIAQLKLYRPPARGPPLAA